MEWFGIDANFVWVSYATGSVSVFKSSEKHVDVLLKSFFVMPWKMLGKFPGIFLIDFTQLERVIEIFTKHNKLLSEK
jgi:hypothetical protein